MTIRHYFYSATLGLFLFVLAVAGALFS